VSIPRIVLPNCPECDSDDTTIAYEKFGSRTFCCSDCGHAWRVCPQAKQLVQAADRKHTGPRRKNSRSNERQ
jgi:Zn ribbon nucleic-acid-binding protein